MSPGEVDPFVTPEAWDEDTALLWADVLEQRNLTPTQIELRAQLLQAAKVRRGATVVEVGCGTGMLLAEIAEGVGPHGRAIGFEPQPLFADLARARLAERG